MPSNRIDQTHTWLLSRANARAQAIRVEAFAAAGSSGYLSRLLASLAAAYATDVVAAVNDLQARRFVTRQRDPLDARRNVVKLTRAGRVELARLGGVVTEIQERFLEVLSDNERRQLHRILTKLVGDRDSGDSAR